MQNQHTYIYTHNKFLQFSFSFPFSRRYSDTHNLDQSLAGTTLANLKKQRAQSRTSTASENGVGGGTLQSTSGSINQQVNGGQQSMELSVVSTDIQTPKITKFSGVTSDVVSDSTSRRCCVIM